MSITREDIEIVVENKYKEVVIYRNNLRNLGNTYCYWSRT